MIERDDSYFDEWSRAEPPDPAEYRDDYFKASYDSRRLAPGEVETQRGAQARWFAELEAGGGRPTASLTFFWARELRVEDYVTSETWDKALTSTRWYRVAERAWEGGLVFVTLVSASGRRSLIPFEPDMAVTADASYRSARTGVAGWDRSRLRR